jgi:hypothetical protein
MIYERTVSQIFKFSWTVYYRKFVNINAGDVADRSGQTGGMDGGKCYENKSR